MCLGLKLPFFANFPPLSKSFLKYLIHSLSIKEFPGPISDANIFFPLPKK